jgi:hypothetical protein
LRAPKILTAAGYCTKETHIHIHAHIGIRSEAVPNLPVSDIILTAHGLKLAPHYGAFYFDGGMRMSLLANRRHAEIINSARDA